MFKIPITAVDGFFFKILYLFGLYKVEKVKVFKYINNFLFQKFNLNIIFKNKIKGTDFDTYTYFNQDKSIGTFGLSFIDSLEGNSIAIGEYLERIAFSNILFDQSTISKPLGYIQSFQTIQLFSDYHRFNVQQNTLDSTEVDFIYAKEVFSSKKVFFPKQLFFYGNDFPSKVFLGPRTSSGGAGGFTREMAMKNSLCELFERDTFLNYWLGKFPGVKIESGTLPDKYKILMSHLAKNGVEIEIVFLKNEIDIPVTLGLLKNSAMGFERRIISLGSGMNIEESLNSLFKQAFQLSVTFNDVELWKTVPSKLKNLNTLDQIDKYDRFFLLNSLSNVDFLFSDKSTTKYSELQTFSYANSKEILCNIRRIFPGKELYEFEIKSKLINQFGFRVIKLVFPYLLPLYLVEADKIIESQRLKDFSKFLNLCYTEVNKEPHPLP